ARQAAAGRPFGPDTPWQRELEDAFPFTETPDQMSTIDEVKADMERPIPMDRLICGDVGYGKTEIAVRAAFKAVQDGTQVAVLVPTTLLVSQHTKTFTERFSAFPVRVAALSRFQSPAEVRDVCAGLTDGTVDVVIATHRLLSPEIRFKELGLVIVDEEQRFGVEHKEHLKALRANVDVLAMSATPIPRTLEMAVTGIRELSTIQTPPEERLPVLTFVGRYDDRQVAAAIRRELLRDGQVFFIHNRVKSIDRVAARVRDLVPNARVAIAHGQMPEAQLEQVILDFWERRVDVLVCTTIVESGLDISNANTLIVDRADRFGLSQLHQLRGRVGRGSERAYAYFMYEPDGNMTEAAHQRLATIAQHTDLGAGIAVAMKDLEIRGAGNLLGGEQSGHIADVGFDLYVRLVGEALAEATGRSDGELVEVRVELPVDARIPEDYVSAARLRLAAYRQIAAADQAQIDAAAAELVDRFGPLPAPVKTLLEVANLKLLARRAGLAEIVQAGTRIRMSPVELPESAQLRLSRLFPGSVIKPATRTILVPVARTAKVGGSPLTGNELLAWTRNLIETALLVGPMPGKENK
ncbi:MAG: helicase-related protein, partial [Candidatus Nanopelagicales bacterium]|nr:helicase-related protein [Candidatus Nanopelagicales bacterium]